MAVNQPDDRGGPSGRARNLADLLRVQHEALAAEWGNEECRRCQMAPQAKRSLRQISGLVTKDHLTESATRFSLRNRVYRGEYFRDLGILPMHH
jgi:hypothetical protein